MEIDKYWKVRREISELWAQMKSAPEFILGTPARLLYDALFHRLTEHHYTQLIPETEKISLFVIHQPHGISDSFFLTLDHLTQNGYSILVISNGRLTQEDIRKLRDKCWYVLIRPNIGYDFGGYRDGLRILKHLNLSPKFLLLINDSIWYPIIENDDLLERLENLQSDFCGPTLFGDDIEFYTGRERYPPFLASFMMLFREDIVKDERFWSYWKSYRFSNNKRKTMRRGERGLSQHLKKIGYPPSALLSKRVFQTYIERLTLPQMIEGVHQIVVIDPHVERQRVALCATAAKLRFDRGDLDPLDEASFVEHKDLRADMIGFFNTATRKPNYVTTAPVIAHFKLGTPYLKKNIGHPIYLKSLQMVLNFESDRAFPLLLPGIRQEILKKTGLDKQSS